MYQAQQEYDDACVLQEQEFYNEGSTKLRGGVRPGAISGEPIGKVDIRTRG